MEKLSASNNQLSAKLGAPPETPIVDLSYLNVWQALTQMYIKLHDTVSQALITVQTQAETVEDLS
jgi:hypothetical protein